MPNGATVTRTENRGLRGHSMTVHVDSPQGSVEGGDRPLTARVCHQKL